MLETLWDKRRILEVYLNVVEWGNGVFGAEAAARRYFNVRPPNWGRPRQRGWRSCCPIRASTSGRISERLQAHAGRIRSRMLYADVP